MHFYAQSIQQDYRGHRLRCSGELYTFTDQRSTRWGSRRLLSRRLIVRHKGTGVAEFVTSATSARIVPLDWLEPRLRSCRFVRLPSWAGMGPLSRLRERLRS